MGARDSLGSTALGGIFPGLFLIVVTGSFACQDDEFPETWDEDGDGYGSQDDCDPGDPTVYPGAPETCDDGIDSDCAGDLESTEVDNDEDGFSECAGDCDDGDDNRFPDNPEACDE